MLRCFCLVGEFGAPLSLPAGDRCPHRIAWTRPAKDSASATAQKLRTTPLRHRGTRWWGKRRESSLLPCNFPDIFPVNFPLRRVGSLYASTFSLSLSLSFPPCLSGSLYLSFSVAPSFAHPSGRIVCLTRSKIQDFRREETPVDVFVAYTFILSVFLFFSPLLPDEPA